MVEWESERRESVCVYVCVWREREREGERERERCSSFWDIYLARYLRIQMYNPHPCSANKVYHWVLVWCRDSSLCIASSSTPGSFCLGWGKAHRSAQGSESITHSHLPWISAVLCLLPLGHGGHTSSYCCSRHLSKNMTEALCIHDVWNTKKMLAWANVLLCTCLLLRPN